MSAIVALENGTTLDLTTRIHSQTRDTCEINKGGFILFSGTQVHGGSSYKGSNLRLHFYLHEYITPLKKITNGKIDLQVHCPLCTFSTMSNDYLENKHIPKMHREWWNERKKGNKWRKEQQLTAKKL
jgi:hypothetical protein